MPDPGRQATPLYGCASYGPGLHCFPWLAAHGSWCMAQGMPHSTAASHITWLMSIPRVCLVCGGQRRGRCRGNGGRGWGGVGGEHPGRRRSRSCPERSAARRTAARCASRRRSRPPGPRRPGWPPGRQARQTWRPTAAASVGFMRSTLLALGQHHACGWVACMPEGDGGKGQNLAQSRGEGSCRTM